MKKISAKSITIYGMFIAAAFMFSYVEMLFPLTFIAPGMKLGIANTVSLFLVLRGKKRGAFFVNAVRILLSAILFGNVFSLVFSFSAGLLSLAVVCFFEKFKKMGIIGLSVLGSSAHNFVQILVATVTVGEGVWYYAPLLLVLGIVTGALTGFLASALLKYTSNLEF